MGAFSPGDTVIVSSDAGEFGKFFCHLFGDLVTVAVCFSRGGDVFFDPLGVFVHGSV